MKLADLVEPTQCGAGEWYADKSECLSDLARRAARALGAEPTKILEALLHREALGSTGLGAGIALPHARITGIGRPYLTVVRLRDAIAFDSIDGCSVDIVCLVLLPAEGPACNDVLACAARRLRDGAVLMAMRKAKSPQALYEALAGQVGV